MRSPVIRGEEKRRGKLAADSWERSQPPKNKTSEGGRERGEERIFPPNSGVD